MNKKNILSLLPGDRRTRLHVGLLTNV